MVYSTRGGAPFRSRKGHHDCTPALGRIALVLGLAFLSQVQPGRELSGMRGEFVDVGGARLYCYAAGTRGAGEPVVLLHGFPGSSHVWRHVVPLLPEGHRVVVLDLLGSGRSDLPSGASALTALAHASRLRHFFDELSIGPSCVVGHGAGGAVAQVLALEAPQLVTRLALVNSTGFDTWLSVPLRLARAVAGAAALLGDGGALPLSWLLRGALRRGYATRAGAASLAQYLRAYRQPLGIEALVAQLAAARDAGMREMSARLGALTCPTAVIWGSRDPFLPASLATQLAAAARRSTLTLIPEASHFSPEDTPEAVASAIRALLLAR
jgi:pimeloyl-ACP methyl ester carboxylesterase